MPVSALAFQRGVSESRARKVRRHFALKHGHVLSLLLLQVALFAVLHEAWIYLLTWDHLKITNVKVVCPHPSLSREIAQDLRLRSLGNILLCNVRGIEEDIRSLAWVREARVSRVYPSTLHVDVEERRPAALMSRSAPRLIDREGVDLGEPETEIDDGLPLFTDRDGFRFGVDEKLKTAWSFLDALPETEKGDVESLDLTDSGGLSIKLRNDPILIQVAAADALEGLNVFRERRPDWEARFGPLESVDLRFSGRAVLKPAGPGRPAGEARRPQFTKEAD